MLGMHLAALVVCRRSGHHAVWQHAGCLGYRGGPGGMILLLHLASALCSVT